MPWRPARAATACAALVVCAALAGCTTPPKIWQFGRVAWAGLPDPTAGTETGIGLRTDRRYLRVQMNDGPPALLVLGYLDPAADGREVATWYSARQEMLQRVDGRIVATAGLAVDWLSVRWQGAPSAWAVADAAGFDRVIEVRANVTEVRAERVQVVAARADEVPAIARPTGGDTARWARWRWYRETSTPAAACCSTTPEAWFAIDPARAAEGPVYAYQCLAAGTCLRLETWPPAGAPAPP